MQPVIAQTDTSSQGRGDNSGAASSELGHLAIKCGCYLAIKLPECLALQGRVVR